MISLQNQTESDAESEVKKRRASRMTRLAAAAVVVLVLGIGIAVVALLADVDTGQSPAGNSQTFGTASALDTAGSYIDAYNEGDEGGVLS